MRRHLGLASLVIIAISLCGTFLVAMWDLNRQEAVGQLHFPISCGTGSQRLFDLATSRLHTLRFADAQRAYTAIADAAPDCAMAHWGIAMSRLGRPVPGERMSDDLRAGRAVLQQAARATMASPRERAYIAALTLLFQEVGVAWQGRAVAYENAMHELASSYPEDKEAVIFYALALNISALPSDKNFKKQTKSAELLLVALSEQPHHPGLSHYLTYCLSLPPRQIADAPELAASRDASATEAGLAAFALLGVAMFFVAVLPSWSRATGS